MGSIRTITFGKASFKWNTGRTWQVNFYHNSIQYCYRTYIKPNFKVKNHSDIRSTALKIMEDALNGDIITMQALTNLIVAMRFTQINENEYDEEGYFKVSFMYPPHKYERITFYNVPWHINHHCKQTYKFCFVQVVPLYRFDEDSIAYTSGEYRDRLHSDGVDLRILYDIK